MRSIPGRKGFIGASGRLIYFGNISIVEYFEKFRRAVDNAMLHRAYHRQGLRNAMRLETDGASARAETERRLADADHRRACAFSAEAARIARKLVRATCADWTPDPTVAASGLDAEEMMMLCDVVGSAWRKGADGDAV